MTALPDGLERFCRIVAVYFGIPEEVMGQAYRDYLGGFAPEVIDQAVRDWEAQQILPSLNVCRDEQVGQVWGSPLFPIYALGFTPPAGTDLRKHMLPPVRRPEQVAERLQFPLPPDRPYWLVALRRTFPELYLLPELEEPARGLDLACGWGRACLSLRDEDLEVHGCDLTESGLERLKNLAAAMGRSSKIHAVKADVTALPYPENHFDFMLAFDIFEHLTDPTLDRALAEVLRVARPGALLYTEVPPDSFCPPVTHLQKFTLWEIFERFRSFTAHGKSFVLARYAEEVPDQFSFRVVDGREESPGAGSFGRGS